MVSLIEFFAQFDSTVLLLIIVIVFSLQIIFLTFPLYILMIFIGYTYGMLIGGIINVIGLVWASLIGFEIGKKGNGKLSRATKNKFFDKYLYWSEKYGIKALIFVRLVPVLPYNVVSVGSGLTKIHRREFLWINVITNMHWSFFLAFIGQGYFESIASKIAVEFDPRKWIMGVIGIFAIVIILYKKLNRNVQVTETATVVQG